MELKEAIEKRRAYRNLEPVKITEEMAMNLADTAKLSASCFNNQPWRFVFVIEEKKLGELKSCLSKGNAWATKDSMIVAVFSKKELDCISGNTEYYLFDTGMACAFIQLRATELGLVCHPISGFDAEKAKAVLKIPGDYTLITLMNVGKKSEKENPLLSESQKEREKNRPERLAFEKFAYFNEFKE